MNWADLNPVQRAKKPTKAGKVYIGANHLEPHAGLSVFAESRPTGGCFCVEGVAGEIKAEFCGKLLDWDRVSPRFLASLKTGGSVTVSLDAFKTLIR